MNKGIGGINNEIGTEKILIDASIGGNTAVQIMDKTPIRFKKHSFMSFLKPHTHPFGLDLKPKYNCFTQIID